MLAGGQTFDLVPQLFLRVAKPAANLESLLPTLTLTDFFELAGEGEELVFSIMRNEVSEEDMAKVEISDPKAVEFLSALKEFSFEQDVELSRQLDSAMKKSGKKLQDFNAAMVDAASFSIAAESALGKKPARVLQIRSELLLAFQKAWDQVQ